MRIFILLLCLCLQSQAQEKFNVRPDSSTLEWTGHAAFNGYAPTGTLQILEASATVTNSTITQLSAVVDMRSLSHENDRLQNHLRDKDFFYIKKFPVATFILDEPASISEGKATLTGTMTLRGVSQKEQIQVTIQQTVDTITLEFDHSMDRTAYGIEYNSPSVFKKLKENAIADQFELKARLLMGL